MDQTKLTAILTDVLAIYPEVSLVYLFGSQVSGETGPLSDVDLAVWAPEAKDDLALTTHLAHLLGKALPASPWQVISLHQAPVELAYAVIAKGICLYQRSPAERVEYEAQVLGLYGDYLPVLRAQRVEILRGGEHERRVQRNRAALRRTQRTLNQIRDITEKT